MNILLRAFAGAIDLLQFLLFVVFLALTAMTPVGGGAVGGVTGATICWNASGNVVSATVNAVYCAVVGAGIGAFGAPIGIAIDIAISSTFGVLLIVALAASGRFSFFPTMFAFVGEMTPGVNAFVPAWSILVHRCIRAHKKKTGTQATTHSTFSFLAGGTSSPLGIPTFSGVASQIAAPRYAATRPSPENDQSNRAPLVARNFDGIRSPQKSVKPKTYAAIA